MLHVDLREIFEYAHLKFTVSGQSKQVRKQASKQASIDTHACAQCSHASVGLAQARPKYPTFFHSCFFFGTQNVAIEINPLNSEVILFTTVY